VCLIRLGAVRPIGVPGAFGVRSENAAHRIAVTFDTADGPRTGVYIPRRDSASALTVWAGGRLFPGEHSKARFTVAESVDELAVAYAAHDGSTAVGVRARITDELRGSTLFGDLAAASAFFRAGPVGYSATAGGRCLDGVRLSTTAWSIEPTEILDARSTFYDDPARFPAGTATLDSALVMRNVPALWGPVPPLALAA
jgi:hypothetical protein